MTDHEKRLRDWVYPNPDSDWPSDDDVIGVLDELDALRARLATIAESARESYSGCVMIDPSGDAARVAGYLLNMICGTRVASEGGPVPTRETVSNAIHGEGEK